MNSQKPKINYKPQKPNENTSMVSRCNFTPVVMTTVITPGVSKFKMKPLTKGDEHIIYKFTSLPN